MDFGFRAIVAISLVVFPALEFAQVKSDEPVKTKPCDLLKEPEQFNGKIVKVNSLVLIGFEDFELSDSDCDGKKINGIWLEYGKGPKRQPTTWCCGDMVPRDPLALFENNDFRTFHRYLTAQKTNGCHEGQCYLYEVTATLTGRFDSVKTETCADVKRGCCKDGFGHLGGFCGRIVIQSVSEVVAKPFAPPVREKKR